MQIRSKCQKSDICPCSAILFSTKRFFMLKETNRKERGAMTEQYQVTIQGQLGPREGVLTLSYQESYITGSLDLVGYVNKVQGVRAADGDAPSLSSHPNGGEHHPL